MKVKIWINGKEYLGRTKTTGNAGNDVTRAARQIAKENGIDWKMAKVFALHPYENGRAYAKEPGYITLGGYG